MTGNPRDALLLIGDSTVEDLIDLAQKRLPTHRVQVLALAAARPRIGSSPPRSRRNLRYSVLAASRWRGMSLLRDPK